MKVTANFIQLLASQHSEPIRWMQWGVSSSLEAGRPYPRSKHSSCHSSVRSYLVVTALLLFLAAPLSAETYGLFTYTSDGTTVTITDYPWNAAGPVVIPATINGKPVSAIGVDAFSFCSGVTSVTFASPSAVSSIGEDAFNFCSVAAITIPPSVRSIGNGAFAWCDALTSVTFTPASSLTSIGNDAFLYCDVLTAMTIPASVTSIGEYAFSSCEKLASVTLASPSSLTSIGKSAFYYCRMLTGSLAFPSSLASIGDSAFTECDGLTSVTFASPSSLTSIGKSAFDGCGALTGITMPASVASIGNFAFANCGGLAAASFLGKAPSMGAGVFLSARGDFSVYYYLGKSGYTSPLWLGYPSVGVPPGGAWLVIDQTQGSIRLWFLAEQGVRYSIEASANLMSWSNLEGGIGGNGGILYRDYPMVGLPDRCFRTRKE